MRVAQAVEEEEEPPFRPGDVVNLPDGGIAAVARIAGDDVYVIEWQKRVGRGPWIFSARDLVRMP